MTDEERAAGITDYEDGHTVIISLAQGKSAGTDQNKTAGWAHNLAMPVEIFLAPNGKDVIRKPVSAVETLYKEEVYNYKGSGISANEFASQVSNIRSDMYEIKAKFKLNPTQGDFSSGFYVRYNPTENYLGTERTAITFRSDDIVINRLESSLLSYVQKSDTWHLPMNEREYDVTIYVDRSQLEVYINGIEQFTTRIYPKYGDSDYISAFDFGGGMTITECTIRTMKGMLKDEVVPAYYENTGNLAGAI
jgi:sucrose-6-phosphate hydrolase SacC (GH32 family)